MVVIKKREADGFALYSMRWSFATRRSSPSQYCPKSTRNLRPTGCHAKLHYRALFGELRGLSGRDGGAAETVTMQERLIADHPGLRGFISGRCSEKRLHNAVIGVRLIGEATAIAADHDKAGLCSFDKMGKRPIEPSSCVTSETGAQAPASEKLVGTRPPALSPRRMPSPVLLSGAADQCSLPVGAC
jgi:hypothetical protein